MDSATVFDGVFFLHPGHTGFFHDPDAGGVFPEGTGDHLLIAKFLLLTNCTDLSCGGVAFAPVIRVDHIAKLDGTAVFFHIIEKTDALSICFHSPDKSVLRKTQVEESAEKRHGIFRLCIVRQHIGSADTAVCDDGEDDGRIGLPDGTKKHGGTSCMFFS